MNNHHIEIASCSRLNITLSNPVYMVEIEYKGQIKIYRCIKKKDKANQNKRIKAGTTWTFIKCDTVLLKTIIYVSVKIISWLIVLVCFGLYSVFVVLFSAFMLP